MTTAGLAGPVGAQNYGLPVAVAPPPPAAPGVLLSPYIGLQESYTDNVNLTPTNKKSDFVTRGMIGVNAVANVGRLSARLDTHYAQDWYASTAHLDGGSVFADGSATYTLLPDRLWLDADGTVTNGYTSSFGQSAISRSGVDGRAQIGVYRIGPQFSSTLGDIADLQAAARFMQVFYSKADGTSAVLNLPANDSVGQIVARADTGDRHSGVELLTTGQYQTADHGFHMGNAVESAYVRLTPGLRAIARAGYERVYQTDTTDISAALLSAGLEFRFRNTSTITLEGGSRYDHTAWAADADIHLGQKLSLTAYYREQIAPDQIFVAGSFAEFVAETSALPPPIIPVTLTLQENVYNETSFNKNAQIRMIFQDEAQSASVTAWWSDRHFLRSNTHDRSATGSIYYSRALRRDLGASVSANYSRTFASPIYGQSENYGASADLLYYLNSTADIRGSYNFRRSHQISAGSQIISGAPVIAVAGQEITENVFLIAIEKRF